jgi:osmotically-inducible protein OsmY
MSRLVPAILIIASLIPLGGCVSTAVSLGADAAYTASELRTIDEVVLDNKIKIKLNELTADDSFDLWKDVGTVVYQGRVLLVGSTETEEAKAKAGEIGGTPEGVKEVINDIKVTGEGGVGSFVNDVSIEKSIQVKYLFDDEVDSSNYRVRSVHGTVYLIGLAKSQAELDMALEIARGTSDVKEIVNYMRIRPPKS